MNKLEFYLMNNPVRRFIQARLEIQRMKKMPIYQKAQSVF